MRSTLFALIAVSVAAIYACGSPPEPTPPSAGGMDGGSSAPTTMAPDAGSSSAPPTASNESADAGMPNVPTTEAPAFDTLPKDQKANIMMTKVVPNVGKEFKDFDGKRFAKFGCTTCHGPTKKEDPHKVLPKLTLSNGGFEKLKTKNAKMVEFMAEKVVPAMATALNEKPMDPTTHKGFGCGGCHEVK